MTDIALSVIITAYNAKNYIEKCVRSVLDGAADEPLGTVEIIAVDDASTDNTVERLAAYGDTIRLIRLSNNSGCIAKTRNKGLEAARGKYITFLDSDDWYEPGALKKLLGYIAEYSPDIVRFGYTNVFPSGERKKTFVNPKKLELAAHDGLKTKIYPQFVRGIGLNSVCLAAFKRDIVGGIRFPENFLTAEDAAFCIEVYSAAKSVLLVPDELYCYYRSGKGLTGIGIGVLKKYRYNFMLVPRMLKKLPQWGMDSVKWRILTVLRPIVLTLDKLKRIK